MLTLPLALCGAWPPTPAPYVQLARNVARSALTGARVWLEYMLMLVVVTFNIGLIVCATLGFMLGALAFGEHKLRTHGSASAGRS